MGAPFSQPAHNNNIWTRLENILIWTWIFFCNHLSPTSAAVLDDSHPRSSRDKVGFSRRPLNSQNGVEFRASRLVGLQTHEGVGDRTSGSWRWGSAIRPSEFILNFFLDLSDGRKSAAPGHGSFLGLWSKVGPNNGQTMARIRRQKVLKRYGRLLAAPAKLRERPEFRASRLVGAGTHEGVGD